MNGNMIKEWLYECKYMYSLVEHFNFYVPTRPKYIHSHLWHLHFYISTRPKYSIASSTHPFLRINSTRIFYRILETNISSFLLDKNILSHPWHQHFFVSNQPKYSIASSTPQFLRIYSTETFYNRIHINSISSYLLDHNIQSHHLLLHLHFFVSTRPEYSTHPRNIQLFVSTWPKHSTIASTSTQFLRIYTTTIFNRIIYYYTSISSYLLDQNILLDPLHLNFFVSTQPKYSFASSTTPFLRIYSTTIFFRILDTSISLYLLDQNILSHPRHLNFYVSTRPQCSFVSLTNQFLRIYLTRIFHCILNNSISTYLLDQNIPSHPWHLHLYVSTRPKYSFQSVTPQFLHIKCTKIFFLMLTATQGVLFCQHQDDDQQAE